MIVKRRQKRTGVSGLPTITKAEAPGDVWAVDFHSQFTRGGDTTQNLSIVDENTREALGGQVRYSITASNLSDELDVLTIERGSPRALRMDKDPEFISKAFRGWAREVDLVFIRPGQPWRNGFIESFNGRLWAECLGVHQFYSLSLATGVIGIWKEGYNQTRPHSSLGTLVLCSNYRGPGQKKWGPGQLDPKQGEGQLHMENGSQVLEL